MSAPAEKIIDFERLKKERFIRDKKESRNDYSDISVLQDIQSIIDEYLEMKVNENKSYESFKVSKERAIGDSEYSSRLNNEVTKSKDAIQECEDSEEVEILKLKAEAKIPKAIISYIVIFSMTLAVFTTLLVVSFITKKLYVDLRVAVVGIICSLGLVITALVAIKDWRSFVKNV